MPLTIKNDTNKINDQFTFIEGTERRSERKQKNTILLCRILQKAMFVKKYMLCTQTVTVEQTGS
jgi:hypothetical protein